MSKNEYLYPPLPGNRLDTYLLGEFLHRRNPLHEAEVCAAIAARKVKNKMLLAHRRNITERNIKRIS